MMRRHPIRAVTALGLSAPLLVGLTLGGGSLASADPAVQPAAAEASGEALHEAPGEGSGEGSGEADRTGGPTDVFTTGPEVFTPQQRAAGDTSVSARAIAERLRGRAGDPGAGDRADCAGGLDLYDVASTVACTVTGADRAEETFYAYMAPAAVADTDYALYFSQDAPLSAEAATALNDGLNGTGAYPVFDETDPDTPQVLDRTLAAERANYVLDGVGRDDLVVETVEAEVDLRETEPVSATAVETASGRTLEVTLLPIPTDGEAPGMLVSIEGP